MNVLVVGAKGYIGSHLTEHLRRAEHNVTEIEHDSDCMQTDTGFLKHEYKLPTDCNAIIYLAQSPYYRRDNVNPSHLFTVNVINAVRFAELAAQSGIARFIYASTGNVYASSFEPMREDASLTRDNWYSLSKVVAEESLQLFRDRLDISIVRPFGIYGPNQQDKLIPHLLLRLTSGQEIQIEQNRYKPEDHDGLRISLCYIDDVVKMLADLIDVKGVQILNLAGSEVASIRKIATIAAQELGVTPRFKLTDKFRDFDLIADTAYLKTVLNPTLTPLSVGISATVKAYTQQCNNGRPL